MPKFSHDPENIPQKPSTTGVLVTNLGTPAAANAGALRAYLAEFLSDPRVIEAPRLLWWLALHGVILRIRPARAAKAYQEVWREDGSPLLAISQKQAAKLSTLLQQNFASDLVVELGMRYGQPSIDAALHKLRRANATKIIILPLYPQYSATTTASTLDAVFATLKTWRVVPELITMNSYYNHPGYIDSLANSIRQHWQTQGKAERLLFSFHGLPKRYVDSGDPYRWQCEQTSQAVASALELKENDWLMAFQSRFGREEWLKPYTDHRLKEWGQAGIRSVDVIAPGFSADCLETLEEIAMQNRDFFIQAGGKEYRYIPCLNDGDDHIRFLANLIKEKLSE